MGAALSAALAALQFRLLPSGDGRERDWISFLALFASFAAALSWLWLAGPMPRGAFPSVVEARAIIERAGLCVALAAAASIFASRRPSWLLAGASLGGLASWSGFFATRWIVIAHAWSMMGWFAGDLARAALPVALAATLALGCAALFDEDFRAIRVPLLAALLALWAGSTQLALWRLRASYGFGPQDLPRAAGVPGPSGAPLVGVVWLYPSSTTAAGYSVEVRRAALDGVDAQGESLIRLYEYLKLRDYQGVFAREALTVVRRGWLLWWDADRALEAATISRPGRVHPDYLGALALLRAGPLTLERFQKLRALSEMGRDRREGFEDVNRSQLIFEAFSAAFARFGDEQGARDWLFKVDNLWPIYEKKVEASPVESFHEGEISGSLQLDGDKKASSILVGLFLVSTSTDAIVARSTPTLSQSDFPDENGKFAFRDLGAGTYFLGVEGAPDAFSGAISGVPGLIAVRPEAPSVHLDPIRILPVTNP